jgi:hypothetical protein
LTDKLPAISATAAAATAAVTTTAGTTTATAAVPRSPAALRLGTSFVNVHGTTVQVGTVQRIDRVFGVASFGHLNEGEPPRLTAIPVSYDVDAFDCAELRKCCEQIILRSLEAKVPDEYISHN